MEKINVKLLSMAGQGGSAFGMVLMELAQKRDDIIVLSSDMSTPAGLDKFKAAYPDRFMNVGIAEQNMIGIAAGLAEEGFLPICVAQASFITMRCFEQVRQYAGYMGLRVILVGIGSGVSLQYMGNTHYAMEDIALMRTIPSMTVMAPCDALEAVKAIESAVEHDGPAYIRFFGGTGIPTVHQSDYDYRIGRALTLSEGQDIQIIATGSMVNVACKVALLLGEISIRAKVTDMHTIKPLDTSAIDRDTKLIVTLEEHSIIGGLGSAVAECLAAKTQHPRLLMMGMNDCYLKVGSYDYLLRQCGLDVESVKNKIINNLK